MITVTALRPVNFTAVPTQHLPAEGGVAGVLIVDTKDGRRFGLVHEHLLEALTFVAGGRHVIDEHDVLSLDQYDTDDDDRVSFQLRIGSRGEEVASWLGSRRQLLQDVRRCWAIIEDAAVAWGDAQLLHDLHDPGGAWSRHLAPLSTSNSPSEWVSRSKVVESGPTLPPPPPAMAPRPPPPQRPTHPLAHHPTNPTTQKMTRRLAPAIADNGPTTLANPVNDEPPPVVNERP